MTSAQVDDENRVLTAVLLSGGTEQYIYDAEGKRVGKSNGSIAANYIYDSAGQQIGETNGSGTWNRVELYVGARHLGTYECDLLYPF